MSKRSTNTALQYAGIAFLVYLFGSKLFSSVSNNILFGRPRIKLGKVKFVLGIPQSVAATITLPVTNNNPVSFPLDNFIADIIYGSNSLARLRLAQPVSIESGNTTNLVFNTNLDFAQIAGNVASIVASGQYLQSLKLEGTAYSAGVAIPFSNVISVG